MDDNEWLQQENHLLLRLGEDGYPELLAGIAGARESNSAFRNA